MMNKQMRETTVIDSNNTWLCIGSGAVAKYAPSDDDDPSIFQPPEDLYSILATGSLLSIPFWFSILVIVGFQYFLVFLLLASQLNMNSFNLLDLPADVETFVRISQVLLIIIALFSQRDLLAGMESLVRGLPDHFRGNSRFVDMKRSQWRLSAIVRLTQGLLNFLASFVLAVQSETVPDVLLNVLGVAFISDLDDVAFELCKKGYFGGSMKKISNDVCKVRFHRTAADIRKSIPTAKGGIKKIAHIISVFAVFLMALIAFTYLAIRQNAGVYSEQDIRIEFGDEVLPFLGLFNGCYHMSDSRKENAGRLVYEQVGYPNGGKFGFCSDFGEGDGGWTFFIGEHRDDLCEENSYILRSGETSTFSLLEAGKTKWYTYDDLPMDYLEITENKSPTTECGQLIFKSAKEACPSIEAFGTMPMTMLSHNESVNAKSENSLDAAFSHPIYYSNATVKGSFELIFFTGRRWIRTKSDHIQGLGNETTESHIGEFFYSNNGLFNFIEQLRTSVDEGAELVDAVSEVVDTARDQGSPLGLLWYSPRREGVINAGMSETEKLQRNFPSANLARPIDLVWTCLFCNNNTNRCLNDGICDTDKGTCDCKHGWTGKICQKPPTGNGMCNLYFNKEEYNYDGGDCCAGTCKGEDCGKDDLPDLFFGWDDNAEYDYLGSTDTDESFLWYPFRDKPEEWKKAFREREFAYGVNIGISGESLRVISSTQHPVRFSHCKDPNTALLKIEQVGRRADGDMHLPSTTVRCNGNLYLQSPEFRITNNDPNHIFKEELRLPHGVQCEFSFDSEYSSFKISIFAKNQSVPFQQHDIFHGNSRLISLHVPESVCVWNTFAENLIPLMSGDLEHERFAGKVNLGSVCTRDPDEVVERYVVWSIWKSLSFGTMPQDFDGHVCDMQFPISMLTMECSDSRRVSKLHVSSLDGGKLGGIPRGIGSMARLTSLDLSNQDLTSLPSEIGNLTSLESLKLSNTGLISLPSEIGNLTSLGRLDLDGNKLAWIPSEIGNLSSLVFFFLGGNKLTWIPSEIGNLASLGTLDLHRNNLTWIPSEIANMASLSILDLRYNPMTWDSLPIEVQNLDLEGKFFSLRVCKFHKSEAGCLKNECIDTELSSGAFNCSTWYDTYYSYDYLEECEDPAGKNNCCVCGGGNITFFLDSDASSPPASSKGSPTSAPTSKGSPPTTSAPATSAPATSKGY